MKNNSYVYKLAFVLLPLLFCVIGCSKEEDPYGKVAYKVLRVQARGWDFTQHIFKPHVGPCDYILYLPPGSQKLDYEANGSLGFQKECIDNPVPFDLTLVGWEKAFTGKSGDMVNIIIPMITYRTENGGWDVFEGGEYTDFTKASWRYRIWVIFKDKAVKLVKPSEATLILEEKIIINSPNEVYHYTDSEKIIAYKSYYDVSCVLP